VACLDNESLLGDFRSRSHHAGRGDHSEQEHSVRQDNQEPRNALVSLAAQPVQGKRPEKNEHELNQHGANRYTLEQRNQTRKNRNKEIDPGRCAKLINIKRTHLYTTHLFFLFVFLLFCDFAILLFCDFAILLFCYFLLV